MNQRRKEIGASLNGGDGNGSKCHDYDNPCLATTRFDALARGVAGLNVGVR